MTTKKQTKKEDQIFIAIYRLETLNKMADEGRNGIDYMGTFRYFYDRDCIPKVLTVARVFTFPELKEIKPNDIKIG